MSYAHGQGQGGYDHQNQPAQQPPQQPQQQQWYGGGPSSYAAHDYGQPQQRQQHHHAAAPAPVPPSHAPAQPMMMGGYGGYGAPPPAQGPGGGGWGGSMDAGGGDEDYSNEPPLLEELGINFGHIWDKTKTILLPIKVCTKTQTRSSGWSHRTSKCSRPNTTPHIHTQPLDDHIMDDADLAGPLFFLLAFGMFLLLTGKVTPHHPLPRPSMDGPID